MEGGRIVQCGTPRDIFTNPVNEYVADFVAHMNPLGVLTARDVMEDGASPASVTVDVADHVDVVMRALSGQDEINVTEAGQSVGRITADAVMARLLDPRS